MYEGLDEQVLRWERNAGSSPSDSSGRAAATLSFKLGTFFQEFANMKVLMQRSRESILLYKAITVIIVRFFQILSKIKNLKREERKVGKRF